MKCKNRFKYASNTLTKLLEATQNQYVCLPLYNSFIIMTKQNTTTTTAVVINFIAHYNACLHDIFSNSKFHKLNRDKIFLLSSNHSSGTVIEFWHRIVYATHRTEASMCKENRVQIFYCIALKLHVSCILFRVLLFIVSKHNCLPFTCNIRF